MKEETKQFWTYVLSSCLFVVSLITCSLPWSHWAYNINLRPGQNCECILFGQSFSDQFGGGQTVYCQLTTFLQIPLFLTAAFLSFYQGRRALVVRRERRRVKYQNAQSKKNATLILKSSTLLSKNGRILKEGDILVEEKTVEMEPPSYKTSVTLVVISCLSFLVILTIYIILVVGYHWSCNEYRKMLVKLLKASGNMAQILSERLQCTAIFDFMDYLQPKRRIYDPYDYGRKTKIHTGLSLYIGQLALLKNIFIWAYILYFNVKMLRKRIRLDRSFYDKTYRKEMENFDD